MAFIVTEANMTKNKIIAICILAVIFVVTATLAFTGVITNFENSLSEIINPNREISEFFYYFTVVGDTLGCVIFLVVLLILPFTTKKVGIPVASTAIVSAITIKVIKTLVKRARPAIKLLEVGGYSFPSGHAGNNAAIYIGIMLCLLKLCKTKLEKVLVCFVCIFYVAVIGVSRVYFNVHYFSDVVCGWCLGSIIAIVFTELFKVREKENVGN